jgi:DNA repair exonuclease SbcCD ATPase subunit|tara:strand:+ start:733 stop:2445 length:1713 start_codon:yes stop_codon:yes gene_type:complete
MITFQKIRWKNFLSTGNQFTELDFQENTTNLIIGTNGTGKSTVLDALTFVLFNKPFRKINKPQLVNSANERDCLVEIEFAINSRQYVVRRGIKPNVFDIVVNGVEMHREADDRAMQRVLEDNILKVNYKSFTQIVILGSSTFVPFMQLTSSNRREVIEDLLDIRIFSQMSNLLKDEIKTRKDQVKSLDLKKQTLKEKMKMQQDFIDELENRGKANIRTKEVKIQSLLEEENTLMNSNESLTENLQTVQIELEQFTGASDKLRKLGNLKGKISNKVSTITKEHKFFTDNTVCPTCGQDIEEEFRVNRITDAQNKAKELQSGYKELEEAIKEEEERERQFTTHSKEITSLTHGISKNNTRISGCQRQIRDLESEIQRITEQLANRTAENEKLEEFKENLQKVFTTLSEKKTEIINHDFAYSLLRDDGVKTKIIKKYLPLINQQVNRYLQMMDFYINFKLDEEFSETVESPIHEKFSYASFSEGEKMRIDLALLFTWREVARVKNSVNTNLLIMDEVFDSSLDGFGTDEFLKIIRFIIKDANVFVISHKVDLQDKFESVIKFEKVKGFSRRAS